MNRPELALWLQDVLDRLKENDPAITELNQSRQRIDDATVEELASALGHNTTLQKLVLNLNCIGPLGVRALAGKLRKRTCAIKVLEMWNNRLGNSGAKALGSMLKVNRHLVSLHLAGNHIGPQGGRALAEGLKHNNVLKKLWAGRNQFGNKGAVAFGNMLKTNRSLEFLNLFGNSIGPEGARGLALGLRHNTTLQALHLGYNGIANEGVTAFGRILQFNRTLKVLHIWGSSVNDAGLVHLASGLMVNDSLEDLGTTGITIGSAGAKAMQRVLRRNKVLKSLCMMCHCIDTDDDNNIVRCIARGLENNTTLKRLTLTDDNDDDDAGAAAIGTMLKSNVGLDSLELWLCNGSTGNKAVLAIMDGLHHNSTLTSLTIHGNKIDDDCTTAIGRMLKTNCTLKTLSFDATRIKALWRLMGGLRVNYSLERLCIDTRTIRDVFAEEVEFYLKLNRVGRKLLREHDIPAALWAHVLSRTNNDCDLLYYFCCAKPELFQYVTNTQSMETDPR